MVLDKIAVFQPTENVTWRNVNDEVTVLKLDSGEYFTFNSLGRDIWLDLVGGLNLSQIIDKVVMDYEVDIVQAETDVTKFASGLLTNGLLGKS